MPAKERIFFPQGVNLYVPGMNYASDLQLGTPCAFSLGKPAAVSANLIAAATAANAVAGTVVAYTYGPTDSTYGRTLRLTPSGDPGNAASIDIFGTDYLGQPMVERFTGASGVTSILYGKKAFYRVTSSKIVTAAANGVTWAIGTGWRFGLPYKGDLEWAKEAGVYVPLTKRDTEVIQDRAAAVAVAGNTKWHRSTFAGFVKSVYGTPDGGGGATDPVITFKLGATAITGLTITIDTSDVAGLTATDTPTVLGYNANNRFRNGDLIQTVAAAAAGALGDRIVLILTPTQFNVWDATDPQTPTTDDPRGTYESNIVPDSVSEIVVGLVGDNSVNATGNGGLAGIRHVIA